MTGDRSLFNSPDKAQKINVRLGNDKEMMVGGVGTLTVRTQTGELKQLQGVQFVPGLAHNLLSVGQLLAREYSVVFNQDSCAITDNHTKRQVIKIQKSRNNIFPIDVSSIVRLNVPVTSYSTSVLWHLRLGYLIYRSLLIMAHKNMVTELLDMKQGPQCEHCAVAK